jgi:hypothetical protein
VSRLPDGLSAERDRDLGGRRHEPWVRRVFLLALLALVALGLAGVFGQRASTTAADGPAATLSLDAPDRLRGGLLGQGVIRVEARRRIAQPRLVLAEGWLAGMTINTLTPEAADQEDDGGRLVLAYGELPGGGSLTVRIAFQVNPTTIGTQPQDVELRDGGRAIARVARTVTVFP